MMCGWLLLVLCSWLGWPNKRRVLCRRLTTRKVVAGEILKQVMMGINHAGDHNMPGKLCECPLASPCQITRSACCGRSWLLPTCSMMPPRINIPPLAISPPVSGCVSRVSIHAVQSRVVFLSNNVDAVMNGHSYLRCFFCSCMAWRVWIVKKGRAVRDIFKPRTIRIEIFTLAKKQSLQKQRNDQAHVDDGMRGFLYYRAKSWHFIAKAIICITKVMWPADCGAKSVHLCTLRRLTVHPLWRHVEVTCHAD